jgi:hypothetical protein
MRTLGRVCRGAVEVPEGLEEPDGPDRPEGPEGPEGPKGPEGPAEGDCVVFFDDRKVTPVFVTDSGLLPELRL